MADQHISRDSRSPSTPAPPAAPRVAAGDNISEDNIHHVLATQDESTSGHSIGRSRSRASSRSSKRSSRRSSHSGSQPTGGTGRRHRSDPGRTSRNGNERDSHRRSRSSRNRSRSRSLSRVSMDRHVQTQNEADEAVQTIKTHPGGTLLLSLINQINQIPGNLIDLKQIADQVDKLELDKRESSQVSQPVKRTQFIGYNPCPSGENDRQILRNTLLDIELNDRTVQRRMIEPPHFYRTGTTSISDRDQVRLDKVKIYFSAAFSNRKFSGRRGRNIDELSILQLLQEFNHAQDNIPVTENEFVTFLTKAMTGEAHKTMLNYAELHRNGQMSINDIYLSLTDIYFSDMRPNTAMQKLRDMTEHNHTYGSLSEAHNDLLQTCNLASLAARARERQLVLAADWYQQTLLRIIPREYKPMATSLVESCGNYKGKDLEPHEILNSLSKIRNPIDDLLRKSQTKSQIHRVKKNVWLDPQSEDEKETTDETQGEKVESAPQKKRIKALNGQSRNNWKTKFRAASGHNASDRRPLTGQNRCRLCGNPKHTAGACPLFPEGRNMVAASECKKCNAELFHLMRFCPQNGQEEHTKN